MRGVWTLLVGLAGCGAPCLPPPADFDEARERLVAEEIEPTGVRDERVLAAMRRVPRHEFVPPEWRALAYLDRPLPIGHHQTISQPSLVARMTELAGLEADSRVLEVGTGSGYQAAILAELAGEVYSIEIIGALAEQAAATLARLGYDSIQLRHGDGYLGWPEASPFDAIVVTAAANEVPAPLLEQLAPGGRLVIPVGDWVQELEVHERTAEGIVSRRIFPVQFVPLTRGVRDRGPEQRP